MDKWKAASEGTKEIFFAVISTSLTLAIVFIPVIFLSALRKAFQGVWYCSGKRHSHFSISIAYSNACFNVKLGGSLSHHSKFYLKSESFFVGMENGYRKALKAFIWP
jgi:hypothetical protein